MNSKGFRAGIVDFVKNLGNSSAPRRKKRSRGANAGRRVFLELLEYRRQMAVIVVNTVGDGPDVLGAITLRDAIVAAETNTSVNGSTAGNDANGGGDIIQFAPGVTGPISLTTINDTSAGSSFEKIASNITIDAGAGITIQTTAGRFFNVVGASAHLMLSHVTLSGGNLSDNDEGGAILIGAGGIVDVKNSKLSGNKVTTQFGRGGAIGAQGATGTLNVDNSTFSGNSATGTNALGGAIDFQSTTGSATITNSTFSTNAAQQASAISFGADGAFNVTNTTVSGNSASTPAGLAVDVYGHAPVGKLLNVTVAGNAGGGVGNQSTTGSISLQNTIVAGNTQRETFQITSVGNNIILAVDGFSGTFLGSDIIGFDPMLLALGNNGGPTQTRAFAPGSKAFDGGNDAAVGLPANDQRGTGFPRTSGDHVDIGAWEAQVVQPTISIDSVTHNEGNAGTTVYTFTMSLSAPSFQTVTVDYATATGSATIVGGDFNAASGTLTFDPSDTSKTLIVTVNGDTTVEQDEAFTVVLSNPTNATIASGTGTGNITNDDSVSVTTSTLNLPINATTVTIAGVGFDPVAANNTVVFNDGAVGTVTTATGSSLTVTFSTQPTAVGSLTAVATTNGVSSGAAVQVATVAPVVTLTSTNLPVDSTTVMITGLGFDPVAVNNTVVFNEGAVGTVTVASATSLTVTLSTQPTTAGSLTAIVTTDGVDSGAAVQVALVAPVVTATTTNLPIDATSVTITGLGFDSVAANNTVVFNDGAVGTVTTATATSLTVTFSTQPTAAGSLTAIVTTNGQSSGAAVQVATVTVPPIITSPTVANVGITTVTLGGNVTSANGTVLERGVLVSLSSVNTHPTLGGTGVKQVTAATNAEGVFTVDVTGLKADAVYSFVAYVRTAGGVAYTAVRTFDLNPRQLTGTAGNDFIYVMPLDSKHPGGTAAAYIITVSHGKTHRALLGTFDSNEPIVINGLAGNDTVEVAGNLRRSVTFIGGAGNDVLIGGPLNDTLDGGSGNDVLIGVSGRDNLKGGSGRNTIVSGTQSPQAASVLRKVALQRQAARKIKP
jgi:hypothetical protein